MTHLNLTNHDLCMQAQKYHGGVQDSLEVSDCDREEQEDWGSEFEGGLDGWGPLDEDSNLEYGVALQEAEGIARHEKAFEACEWVKGLLKPEHTSPLFQACVNELFDQRQRNHAKPGCCNSPHHRVECWAQWDQQMLGFISTWIWQQLKEQGFVNEGMDDNHFGGVVYQTVFSDCWKDIYEFFLANRESIKTAKAQPRQSLSSQLGIMPEHTDPNLSSSTKTMFENVLHDWLSRLELDPHKISAYLRECPAHTVSAQKAIWTLYKSLIANNSFFSTRRWPDDLMNAFIKYFEPNSSLNNYMHSKNLEALELGLALRTLAKILSQTPHQDLEHH